MAMVLSRRCKSCIAAFVEGSWYGLALPELERLLVLSRGEYGLCSGPSPTSRSSFCRAIESSSGKKLESTACSSSAASCCLRTSASRPRLSSSRVLRSSIRASCISKLILIWASTSVTRASRALSFSRNCLCRCFSAVLATASRDELHDCSLVHSASKSWTCCSSVFIFCCSSARTFSSFSAASRTISALPWFTLACRAVASS
mmetsp:Transcript_29708/g.83746  ORF Transcript_29708/g.83746 Transcript_29708/m.83746 type:complete len:203 (-) Transcript_29708:652-1260(-)